MTDTTTTLRDELAELLAAPRLRIELSTTFAFRDGDLVSLPSAQVFRHEQTPTGRDRWVKDGPVLVPTAGLERGDLLEMLTMIARPAPSPAGER